MNFKEKITLIKTSINHEKKPNSKNALGIKVLILLTNSLKFWSEDALKALSPFKLIGEI